MINQAQYTYGYVFSLYLYQLNLVYHGFKVGKLYCHYQYKSAEQANAALISIIQDSSMIYSTMNKLGANCGFYFDSMATAAPGSTIEYECDSVPGVWQGGEESEEEDNGEA